jgi:hypothetical protein
LLGNPEAWRLVALATAVLVVMLKAAAPAPSSTDTAATEVKHLRTGLALAVALIVAGTIGQHLTSVDLPGGRLQCCGTSLLNR